MPDFPVSSLSRSRGARSSGSARRSAGTSRDAPGCTGMHRDAEPPSDARRLLPRLLLFVWMSLVVPAHRQSVCGAGRGVTGFSKINRLGTLLSFIFVEMDLAGTWLSALVCFGLKSKYSHSNSEQGLTMPIPTIRKT